MIIVDSDERCDYERANASCRWSVPERSSEAQAAVDLGEPKRSEKIGAAAERIMHQYHGYRYFGWECAEGKFDFSESQKALEAEKRIEGKYVIATTEKDLSVREAVEKYKELMDMEQGFRRLKDVLAMRPIYHQVDTRVKAHIFVAASRYWFNGSSSSDSKRYGCRSLAGGRCKPCRPCGW